MTVLTIFFCGTGSNKFDTHHENFWNGELISTLAANHCGREFAEWIVVDGPGSGNLQAMNCSPKPRSTASAARYSARVGKKTCSTR